MFWQNILSQSLRSLSSNRLRSALTMLGVIWGTASVVFLLGWGKGFVEVMKEETRVAGDGFVMVFPKRAQSKVSGRRGARQLRFELDEVDAVLDHCPSARYAIPVMNLDTPVKKGNKAKTGVVYGVDVDAQHMYNVTVERGRFLQPHDLKDSRRVAVIGSTIAKTLFPSGREAIGDRIKILGLSYEVIGVLVEKGDQLVDFGGMEDEKVYIPVTAYQRHISGSRYISEVVVQPFDTHRSSATVEEIRLALAHELNFMPDDKEALEVIDFSAMLTSLDIMALIIAVFVTMIGVITLFVGGVGVMNIMLISVTERTREIGIRKAVGATKKHILAQFLGEALTITVLSGVIGVVLGVGISLGFAAVPRPDILAAPEISLFTLVGSFGVMVLVGFFAGTLPAIRAANLQPVEALRHF
jgi:ABC-type antimicrobial peptide transport system permease subunit